VQAGVAWDVTEAAGRMGFSMRDKVWPASVGEISHEGRQYSYPCNVNVNILIYNKNLFDRFQIPCPSGEMSWKEFADLAARMTRISSSARDTIYGATWLGWSTYFDSLRGEYFSPDGTRILVAGEEMQTAFRMHHEDLFERRITPSSLEMKVMSAQGGWGAGSMNMFADGRFAMIVAGKWTLITFRRAHEDQKAKLAAWEADPNHDPAARPEVLRLGSVPVPHFEGRTPSYRVQSRSAAINSRSPCREQALRFQQYLAGPEYSRLVNEGVDALCGNPAYASLGLKEGVADLSELEMHSNTVASMQYGYQQRRSPFLLQLDVERVINDASGRMESDPRMPIERLLADAQRDLETLMQRNIDRDPALRERYRKLAGTTSVQEAGRRP